MSMTEYPCNECGLPGVNRVFDGGGTAYIHHSCPYRICFKCGQREIADMVKHVCPKAEEKDMANENPCPECDHPIKFHTDHCLELSYSGCSCFCTRTYESLVGEKALSDDELIALAQSKGISCCSNCGKAFHKDKGCSCAKPDKTDCPCQKWAARDYTDWADVWYGGHHPNCDGHGKPKTQFVTGMSIAEPELQLLVIDLGDCCLVKVEKGEWKRRTVTLYRGSATITLPFQRLREELGGVKPVPRIEQCGQEDFIMLYGTKGMHLTITAQQYKSLTEINGGKPLPIWTGGTWEELGHIDDEVYNNTDLRVWRYKR